jgi:hypothetical protein
MCTVIKFWIGPTFLTKLEIFGQSKRVLKEAHCFLKSEQFLEEEKRAKFLENPRKT